MKNPKQTPKDTETTTKFGFKIANAILAFLCVTTLALTVFGIHLYRLTIIPQKYLFAIVVVGTIPAFIIILYRLKPFYKMIWIFLASIVIGGGTFYFLFLYLNSTYSDKEKLIADFKIVSTGTLGRGGGSGSCYQPYAVINFNGTEKELVFYCDYEKTIGTFSQVRLEYSKGLFGFYIIKTKTLLK